MNVRHGARAGRRRGPQAHAGWGARALAGSVAVALPVRAPVDFCCMVLNPSLSHCQMDPRATDPPVRLPTAAERRGCAL